MAAPTLGFVLLFVSNPQESSLFYHVTVAQKPVDMDFGRTFVILDPDGHRIRAYKLAETNR
jgi:hypothetical protein